jgi:hypothetical protein
MYIKLETGNIRLVVKHETSGRMPRKIEEIPVI